MRKLAAAVPAVLVVLSVQALAAPGASAAPLAASITRTWAVFYPPADGYRDEARFTVKATKVADLTLQVREVAGGPLVRNVDLGTQPAGNHLATWDGRDGGGDLVAPGQYVARLVAHTATSTKRSPYVGIRMSWKVLQEHTKVRTRAADTYDSQQGGCGQLNEVGDGAIEFDMAEKCTGPELEVFYAFDKYPIGFRDREKIINPSLLVHADGNHPVGFGWLGVESWQGGEDQAWLWSYDASSGDDGQVEIDVDLRRNQLHRRPVHYSFGGSTGSDYVLDGFVLTMRWSTLVPAP